MFMILLWTIEFKLHYVETVSKFSLWIAFENFKKKGSGSERDLIRSFFPGDWEKRNRSMFLRIGTGSDRILYKKELDTHCPTEIWHPGTAQDIAYSLARNSCLNTSMREKCVICGRGAEFPRASARRCLTFPHSVYSAHRFSSRSVSSPTRCTGFADSPSVDGKPANATALSWGTVDPPRFASWSVWPDFSHCTGMNNTQFRWTLHSALLLATFFSKKICMCWPF